MTLTVGKFRNNVNSGMYSKKQLVNMLEQLLSLPPVKYSSQNLEKIEAVQRKLGVEHMTREDMILKGLIKPAATAQPLSEPTQSSTDYVEPSVEKEITDFDVAKKYLSLQESARRRVKEFNLSLNDVRVLLKKKTCHYTGMRFNDTDNLKRTVDRIDNTKGYVKGNVVACTHIANQLKEMLVENKDSPFKDNTKALKKFIEKL
jgi:hypothetical protein